MGDFDADGEGRGVRNSIAELERDMALPDIVGAIAAYHRALIAARACLAEVEQAHQGRDSWRAMFDWLEEGGDLAEPGMAAVISTAGYRIWEIAAKLGLLMIPSPTEIDYLESIGADVSWYRDNVREDLDEPEEEEEDND